ncbi:bifunctional 2-keto-4-hydroxyglutarate aldolase/2-keto-3-deoxy-6-phosphogluconate aldolase [Clostridium sp. YIM B02515]|uniref:Bifunctional 2-keto-4-hydroxyglutarate aldolase/2-keto-3-deoxy-6-phosphogluconate aldolase n=1 Tax=Clostridium rhizosphaerae TaxID=2803861 RepID=A0ABS1TCX5_9CLOT|nr:bifunctional 2-keto-4-hydroxyglutarate aldolase/2-keto-3-deoxy-6-phosphogluconate aldolase [Clostridium rhizosphaerae]MBL4937150.1 bifunctional 2-keto-4-hydroxyglutarate aldolase/2-keto-3-deoxy-6-phosphogluconate aldolase [Clostridium rhizosphaerae]
MLSKLKVLDAMCESGVIAVIRARSMEEAIEISKACIEGGIKAIEVTYTVPGASDVIKALSETFKDKLYVGAGTVLDSETARTAILSGAGYIVSPGFDEATAKLCNRYGVPYLPGCMTITEMIKAMETGVDIIKLFPGNAFGPSFIKAIKAPLPQANIMPTGGVSLDNVHEWIAAGAIAVGIGGDLLKGYKGFGIEKVKENAKEFVDKVKEARGRL